MVKMKTLLVLEDEPLVMNLLRFTLKKYNLVEARNAEEALRFFHDSDREIDLLLADLSLPVSSGVLVALILRCEIPVLPVILISGYPASDWNDRDTADLKRLGSDSVIVLQKPNRPRLLLSAIDELIGKEQPQKAATARPFTDG
jgi:CheY-like chemotaxis protein